jgi:hypothetical protein
MAFKLVADAPMPHVGADLMALVVDAPTTPAEAASISLAALALDASIADAGGKHICLCSGCCDDSCVDRLDGFVLLQMLRRALRGLTQCLIRGLTRWLG